MIPTHNTIQYSATPVVTYAIIASCAAAFLYQLSLPSSEGQLFLIDNALVPARYTDGAWANEHGLSRSDVLPFLMSMFLHGGILHIFFNMWTLWIFGPALEDRLGRWRFALLYILAGLAAGLAHFVFNFTSAIPALGASGAIAGVIGAYVRRFPYAWINVLQPIGLMPLFLFMPALMFAAIWFATQFIQATGSTLSPGTGGGVAWWAHIGGFIMGWWLIRRLAPSANPVQEQQAATESLLWPWRETMRWWLWWLRRGR